MEFREIKSKTGSGKSGTIALEMWVLVASDKAGKDGRKAVESDFQRYLRLRDEERDKRWQEVVRKSWEEGYREGREEGRREIRLALITMLPKIKKLSLDDLKEPLKLSESELLALRKVSS